MYFRRGKMEGMFGGSGVSHRFFRKIKLKRGMGLEVSSGEMIIANSLIIGFKLI